MQDYAISFAVREDRNGKRYYDHSLTKIEALDLLDQAPESAIEKSSGNSRPTEDASARNAAGGPPTGKQSLNNILKKYLAVNNKNTANTETPINNIRNKNADIDEKAERLC